MPAWPADVCAAKTYNKYTNKSGKGYERIIWRFYESLMTNFVIKVSHFGKK